MAFVRGGAGPAWAPLAESFARSSGPVPAGEWLARQCALSRREFRRGLPRDRRGGRPSPPFSSSRGDESGRRHRPEGPGSPFSSPRRPRPAPSGSSFSPQGSHIHRYWQLWLTLPAAAAVGAAVAASRGRRGPRVAAGLLVALLCLHLRRLSAETYDGILADQLGTPADIEFLASLRNDAFTRLVFIPLTQDPLNDWFQGPGFPYYTDRQVATLEPGRPPRAGEKLLVLSVEGRDEALEEIGAEFGLRFTNETCGPRFCARDVEARAAP